MPDFPVAGEWYYTYGMEHQYLDRLDRDRSSERGAVASEPAPQHIKRSKRSPGKRTLIISAAVIVIIAAVAGGVVAYQHFSPDKVVPEALAKQMSFPVYYPDPKKLPAGYTIDEKSFTSPEKDVILYAVDYNGGKLVFSVQPKPSSAELQAFNTQRIPLHTTLKTSVGTAVIGAISNQSIVSLPTNSNAWIIVTGPYATDSHRQADVLKALRPAK